MKATGLIVLFTDELFYVEPTEVKATMKGFDKKFGTNLTKKVYKATRNTNANEVTVLEFNLPEVNLYTRPID